MPAIITHHLFGEDASRKLPSDVSFTQEELLTFLLGNQGADPYSFCFIATPASIHTCHSFGSAFHRSKVKESLMAAWDAISLLPMADQGIGRAFALGLLAHYLLDSEGHAFVTYQEDAICNAGTGLEDAHGQVHALIESEIDTWMLWSTRGLTIEQAPASSYLARTEAASRIAGTILSQVAWQVFGIKLNPDHYEGCLRDYELIYKTIDPLGNPRARMLVGFERLGVSYSHLDALAHAKEPSDDCPAANLACHPWIDPLDGKVHTTSFPDIYYRALDMWPKLAEAYLSEDEKALDQLIRRNYNGSARTQ